MKETIRIIKNENLQTSLLLAILASREKNGLCFKGLAAMLLHTLRRLEGQSF